MIKENERVVSRDIPATLVPYGDNITIAEGTKVTITHRLGGNFTVMMDYGMARISGENADAIDEEVPENSNSDNDENPHQGPPDEPAIWDALKKVFDPEIPVNIVDLGLVYSMEVNKSEDEKYIIDVKMTLTAPGCGMGPAIAEDAKYKVSNVPGVADANVEIVWDPPWNQEMISEEGKMELGLI